jgi:hypothetical protein
MEKDFKMAEDKPFEIEFKSQFDVLAKRKKELEMSMSKASSFLGPVYQVITEQISVKNGFCIHY